MTDNKAARATQQKAFHVIRHKFLRDYIARGRPHSALSDTDLSSAFVAEMRAHVMERAYGRGIERLNDLNSEMSIRRMPLPVAVSDEEYQAYRRGLPDEAKPSLRGYGNPEIQKIFDREFDAIFDGPEED